MGVGGSGYVVPRGPSRRPESRYARCRHTGARGGVWWRATAGHVQCNPRPVRGHLPGEPRLLLGHGPGFVDVLTGRHSVSAKAQGHPIVPDLVGTTLGRYRVTALVGQGGMATVYKALDPALERGV